MGEVIVTVQLKLKIAIFTQIGQALQGETRKRRLKKKSLHLFGRKKSKKVEPELPVMPPAGITLLYFILFSSVSYRFCNIYKIS